MPTNKPLREMSPDEIAQLTPEQFKELADDHNDQVQTNEQQYQAEIDRARTMPDAELENERAYLEHKRGVALRYNSEPYSVGEERNLSAVNDEQVRRYKEERNRTFANNPEMTIDAKSLDWRPMTDKEISHEIYRLETIANHPDYEFLPEDEKRLTYFENVEQQRQRGEAARNLRQADASEPRQQQAEQEKVIPGTGKVESFIERQGRQQRERDVKQAQDRQRETERRATLTPEQRQAEDRQRQQERGLSRDLDR